MVNKEITLGLNLKIMTYSDACTEVAKKYNLGNNLVTGHRDKYWREAAELYVNSQLAEKDKQLSEAKEANKKLQEAGDEIVNDRERILDENARLTDLLNAAENVIDVQSKSLATYGKHPLIDLSVKMWGESYSALKAK